MAILTQYAAEAARMAEALDEAGVQVLSIGYANYTRSSDDTLRDGITIQVYGTYPLNAALVIGMQPDGYTHTDRLGTLTGASITGTPVSLTGPHR